MGQKLAPYYKACGPKGPHAL